MPRRTYVKGRDIEDESVTGDDILNDSIIRDDLNTTSTGKAVVRRIIAGYNVTLESTGADSGTGDVTIHATSSGEALDHGNLTGLSDDDHTQYHNDARGDARYYQQTEFIDESAGAGDAAKPILTSSTGKLHESFIEDSDIDHGSTSGLGDDDHTQYHNDARGDARYYQQSEFIDESTGSGDASKPILTSSTGKIHESFIEDSDIDHGNLTGLGDDDHTQYHNDTRGDARYYQKTEFIDESTGAGDAAKPILTSSTGKIHESFIEDSDIDHGNLSGLADDDHVQYVLRNQWLQNGFPDPTEVSLSWDDSTMTLTVDATGSSFSYFHDGVLYTKTSADTEQITDTDGLWVFYYDGATLTSLHNPSHTQIDSVIKNEAIVAYVYWDATGNDGRLMYEVHGSNMSPYTHHWLHDNIGASYSDGMSLSDFVIDDDGNDDEDAQFSVAYGEFYDEDITNSLPAIASSTGLEIWYLSSTNWRWTTNPGFSVLTTGSGRLAFNSSGSQTEVGNGKFVLCHVIATNIVNDSGTNQKYLAIQGQAEYGTISEARIGAETEVNSLFTGALPFQEIVFVGTVIFQTSNSYGNAVKARTRTTASGDTYVDWRGETLKASGGTIVDHGFLAGLADDDHLQYHNDARGDARYYQKTEFINESTGISDADKPVLTTSTGELDASFFDTNHRNLDQLVHEIAEDGYCEIERTDGRVSSIIYYTDSGKSTKIREVNYTRSGGRISGIVVKQYDGNGILITGETYTGAITRTGGRVSSIDWSLT